MSDLPPLPSEDINDGEIRVFTYRHLREYGAIARQQGRNEMRGGMDRGESGEDGRADDPAPTPDARCRRCKAGAALRDRCGHQVYRYS